MIDRAVRDLAVAWQREGRAAVVVEVVQTQGSAPRERGTRMLVSADAGDRHRSAAATSS